MAPSSTDSTTSSSHSHDSLSPAITMCSSPEIEDTFPPRHTPNSSLDDIFSPSPPSPRTLGVSPSSPATEPSDIPFLRRQHVTAGYRDGITAAKREHVQRGFDAGFPVGAGLGIRAGVVFGILEGLARCGAAKGGDVQEMYEAAKRQLSAEKVFEDVGGGDQYGEDPCLQLGRRGEGNVADWERRLKHLLGERR